MRPLFLIGFMASGKTTLGRALTAARPELRFVDLDEKIVETAGMPVSEIFAARGEAGFRALESETLRAVALPDTIVACGGGTPCRKENMDYMLGCGTVVRLKVSPEKTVKRLVECGPGRPLVDAYLGNPAALLNKVKEMMSAREEAYSRATAVFDASCLDSENELSGSVARFIQEFLCGTTARSGTKQEEL